MLLELRRAVGPDGVVTAVVRARGHLVDEDVALFVQKQFDRQQTHNAVCFSHLTSDFLRLFIYFG